MAWDDEFFQYLLNPDLQDIDRSNLPLGLWLMNADTILKNDLL